MNMILNTYVIVFIKVMEFVSRRQNKMQYIWSYKHAKPRHLTLRVEGYTELRFHIILSECWGTHGRQARGKSAGADVL